MKKILVVLLVLAVAGGVFAQEGEFSFSGRVDIGVVVDLDPYPNHDVMATSDESQYNQTYDGWDGVKGRFGINYNRDGFGAGLQFTDGKLEPAVVGTLNYGGENFNFAVESNLTDLVTWDGYSFRKLQGDYSFLNGLVYLEAAYAARWQGNKYWASDYTAGIMNYNGEEIDVINEPLGGGNSFTVIDSVWYRKDYLAVDVRLQGLSFGVMMNDIFRGGSKEEVPTYAVIVPGTTSVPIKIVTTNTPKPFVEEVLKNMIFGIKFELNPIEVAAQFLVKDYGVYLGGKWFVGPVTVGLSYMGILGDKEREYKYIDNIGELSKPDKATGTQTQSITSYISDVTATATNITMMKVGGKVNYDTDGYGAAIVGYLSIFGDKSDASVNIIGFEPGIYYNVIPTHLKFKLDAGFYFINLYENGAKYTGSDVNTVQFALQPQLFWNFLGTGAGDYSGNGTGITIRYKLVGGDTTKSSVFGPKKGFNNKFDVNFKWSF